MKPFATSLFALILLTCTKAGAQESRTYTLHVNSHKSLCQGEALMGCMLVRKDSLADTSWEFMHSPIEGFAHAQGFLYTLLVEEEDLPAHKVPADGSSKRYKLLEVLDQKPDTGLADIQNIWCLTHIRGASVDLQTDMGQPLIEFHVKSGRYHGTDGCNRLEGKFQYADQSFRLADASRTAHPCKNDSIPNAFNRMLAQIESYGFDEGKLLLKDGAGEELLRFDAWE